MNILRLASILIATNAMCSCAAREAQEEPRQVAATTSVVARPARGIGEFVPARGANLSGGECRTRQLPASGVFAYTATFPNRREPDTSITVIIDAERKLVRYSENRGLPRPARDFDVVRAENAGITRTHIQLDYVTGEAFASNLEAGSPSGSIMGSVQDFEQSGVLGDLVAKADMVRRLCATDR